MELADAISLAISIGLGIISIALGIFSIWLSMRFNESSNKALDSVKQLSHELKSISEVQLTHQKDFSSKMLDSLLEHGQYGTPQPSTPAAIEETFLEKLRQLESNISTTIEERLKERLETHNLSQGEVREILLTVKEQTEKLKEGTINAAKRYFIPNQIKEELKSFSEYPAHYLVIEAIAKEGITSREKFSAIVEKYKIPSGWDTAINNLAEKEVIRMSEDEENFEIPPQKLNHINRWLRKNQRLISKIRETLKEDDISHLELSRSIAAEFIY